MRRRADTDSARSDARTGDWLRRCNRIAEINFFVAAQRSSGTYLVVASFPVPLCRTIPPPASQSGVKAMGRGILLWLLGVPIPIILIIALLYH